MVSSNNAINNTVGASISGVTNTLTVTNPSNTASSAARETITVGGGTAADPTINWNVSGVTNWEMGIDNSDSDKWKLSQGTALGTNDTMVAFVAGQVLKPLQPVFLAYPSANIPNVTGDSTFYTVVFNTEVTDIGNNFNTATGQFTAPVTGNYHFSTFIDCFGLSAGNPELLVDIVVNGISYRVRQGDPSFDTFNRAGGGGSVTVPMTAAQTAEVQIFSSGGGKTVGVFSDIATFPTYRFTFFSGHLVC